MAPLEPRRASPGTLKGIGSDRWTPPSMTRSDSIRLGCATVYGALSAVALVAALMATAAPGGGMAFTAPVVLGFPWTFLVVPALVQLGFKPNPDDAAAFLPFIAIFIVPAALNVLMILFVGRRRRKPHDRSGEDAEPNRRRTPREREV